MSTGPLVDALPLPCYAVVFTSVRTPDDPEGYAATAARMLELAATQPGYLGVESAHGADGVGITVSYWQTAEAARAWGRQAEHRLAQRLGRQRWYQAFRLRLCRVEGQQVFDAQEASDKGEGMDRSVIDAFEADAGRLRRAVAGLNREELQARPGPGAWSIHEVVIHLVDSDAIAIDRMKRILTDDNPPLLYADESAYVERLHTHAQDLDDALTLFEVGRRQFARVLRRLPDEALQRQGTHNRKGAVTVAALVASYVDHVESHLKFVREKRLKLGKPLAD